MVGAWRVEDHLIGVIATAIPSDHTGSGKDAGRITGQQMILVRIIDPLDRGAHLDRDGLWVKAINVVPSGLLSDRHHDRGA